MRAEELSRSQEATRRLVSPTRRAGLQAAAGVSVENPPQPEDHVETSSLGKIISKLTRRLESETQVREQRLHSFRALMAADKVEIPDSAIDKILSRMARS